MPMNTRELADLLFGYKTEKRDEWFRLLKNPEFTPKYNYHSWHETREHPYRKLKVVTDSKIVSVKDFIHDPHNIYTAHEMLGMVCGSTVVKFTVQFNLFGGSCIALHTDRHKAIFDKIDDMSVCGCFCLTELGFGNNAVKMETTATYDEASKEFVVHSPTVFSQKYWISNGFQHANHALVFGQTIVKGKNEGVNAFLVPIRGADMQTLPGVTVNDMGVKMGLNGVDNAALKFNQVRIPRENMMNRYADVDESGNFSSDVERIPQRFFKVTERLLSGRLCIAAMALGGARGALFIAIKYAQQRKSIGPDGESSVAIFDYQLQQNALMPLLARTLTLNVMYNWARDVYKNPVGFEDELLSLCCIVKTMMGWTCERVASVCRERCGGMGYLSNNRFADYIHLAHAALTAEGDNRVLMTKIVKDMITNVTKKGHKIPAPKLNVKTQIGTFKDVTQLDTLLDLLRFRQVTLFQKLMARMQALGRQGKTQYEILMREVSDNIQDLAMAYGERAAMESAIAFLDKIQNKTNRHAMEGVFRIFGMDVVKRELGFYLVQKAVSQDAAKNLVASMSDAVKRLAKNIDQYVELLNVPADVLYTPIAADYADYYSRPNHGEVVGAKL